MTFSSRREIRMIQKGITIHCQTGLWSFKVDVSGRTMAFIEPVDEKRGKIRKGFRKMDRPGCFSPLQP
jgi:hypothetical protein